MRPADRAARLIAVIGWMALITYWSGQGTLPIDQPNVANALHGLQHRIAHVIAFGMLGLLAHWAFGGFSKASLMAVLLVSVFGAADEWHQSFTPGRRAVRNGRRAALTRRLLQPQSMFAEWGIHFLSAHVF